ncbi:MAG TPA: hypothetical protein VIH59_12140 [Candidatus Tectomicrobia bacterium]
MQQSLNRPHKKSEASAGPLTAAKALLPLTVPEVWRLLWWLVWGRMPPPEQVLPWWRWRRQHQAVAKRCYYKRRLAPQAQLQL